MEQGSWLDAWGCHTGPVVLWLKTARCAGRVQSANSLNAALLAGVNFMLHACGWLEGGLVASFEKFVMDADQPGTLHKLAEGIAVDENPGHGCH